MIYELLKESVNNDTQAIVFIGSVEMADRLIDLLKKYMPTTLSIPDELLAAVAGYLMIKYGGKVHEVVKSIGAGLLVRGIGAYVGSLAEKVIPTTG